jgi:hypothetical protein
MEYVARKNQHGQTCIIQAHTADLPHVSVSFYDGGIYMGGECAVLPGETNEQAALRAFGRRIANKWLDTLTVTPIVWRS